MMKEVINEAEFLDGPPNRDNTGIEIAEQYIRKSNQESSALIQKAMDPNFQGVGRFMHF